MEAMIQQRIAGTTPTHRFYMPMVSTRTLEFLLYKVLCCFDLCTDGF